MNKFMKLQPTNDKPVDKRYEHSEIKKSGKRTIAELLKSNEKCTSPEGKQEAYNTHS